MIERDGSDGSTFPWYSKLKGAWSPGLVHGDVITLGDGQCHWEYPESSPQHPGPGQVEPSPSPFLFFEPFLKCRL